MEESVRLRLLQSEPAGAFNQAVRAALARGEINRDEWFLINEEYFSMLYLSYDNPRAQSGHGGNEGHYAYAHRLITEAITKEGTLLDVGCANGYLMESMSRWMEGTGFCDAFYGLDISEKMIDFARQRLPAWRDRFFIGNALTWVPHRAFDYVLVRQLTDYVPDGEERALFDHLMEYCVAPGGRLMLGPWWIDREQDELTDSVARLGLTPDGYIEKSHYGKKNVVRKVLWFDKA